MPKAGGRGRPPKPTSILRLQGTYRRHRHDKREGELEAEGNLATMPAPEWMSPEQKYLWADILVEAPRDLLKRIDWQLLANYVELVDRHRRAVLAQRKIDRGQKIPFSVQGSAGPVISPLIRVVNQCTLAMRLLQSEMGFTPAARTRIKLERRPTAGDAEDESWALLDRLKAVPDQTDQ